jgi:hypothetical protein
VRVLQVMSLAKSEEAFEDIMERVQQVMIVVMIMIYDYMISR